MSCIMREHHLDNIRRSLKIKMELIVYVMIINIIQRDIFVVEYANYIEHLRTLLAIRYVAYSIEGFSMPDIDNMIDHIAST